MEKIWRQTAPYGPVAMRRKPGSRCTIGPYSKREWGRFPYLDNHITQIHAYTGEVLFHKSLTEILMENGLTHVLVKSETPGDPIHVNDIEPVLHDGPYFKRGDLFISARNGSWIMHYRPATGKVIRMLEGPFYSQHDVDIESDSTLTVFNNNCLQNERPTPSKWPMSEQAFEVGSFSSQAVRIYLNRPGFDVLDRSVWEANEIFSFTEGIVDHLPGGGYFVEEQNSSVLWVIQRRPSAVQKCTSIPSPWLPPFGQLGTGDALSVLELLVRAVAVGHAFRQAADTVVHALAL